ncbi:MAG: RtcB family protein [Candidatus Gastranaerophilales bacterium]|nr:RtcB family protein [Candidatus Gastranaerophilales bacterium]
MIELDGKYTSAKIFTETAEENMKEQIMNVLNHPIFEGCPVRIMPDCHTGKGCVIGFTSPMPKNREVIPNIIGVDQSCRVSAYKIEGKQTRDYLKLDKVIKEKIPTGTGGKRKELHRLISNPTEKDGENIELLRKYTKDWLKEEPDTELYKIGTLGSGNHFISLEKGETGLWLILHSGSRNFGNRMAIEFQNLAIEKHCYGEGKLKELSYLDGNDAEEYLKVAKLCEWYSALSHTVMSKEILEAMDFKVTDFIETVHNQINQTDNVIRKGAVRCNKDEKVIIPINMAYGTFLATGKGNADWNNSGPHGAGRVLSRTQAKEQLSMNKYKESMKGIHSCCIHRGTLDEAPMAYKNGDEIKELISPTAEIFDRLIPVYNFKAS